MKPVPHTERIRLMNTSGPLIRVTKETQLPVGALIGFRGYGPDKPITSSYQTAEVDKRTDAIYFVFSYLNDIATWPVFHYTSLEKSHAWVNDPPVILPVGATEYATPAPGAEENPIPQTSTNNS